MLRCKLRVDHDGGDVYVPRGTPVLVLDVGYDWLKKNPVENKPRLVRCVPAVCLTEDGLREDVEISVSALDLKFLEWTGEVVEEDREYEEYEEYDQDSLPW